MIFNNWSWGDYNYLVRQPRAGRPRSQWLRVQNRTGRDILHVIVGCGCWNKSFVQGFVGDVKRHMSHGNRDEFDFITTRIPALWRRDCR